MGLKVVELLKNTSSINIGNIKHWGR